MAPLNPNAPHFFRSVEASPPLATFFSPFACTSGYPYQNSLNPSNFPEQTPLCGLPPEVLHGSSLVPAPALYQLPLCCNYYHGFTQQPQQQSSLYYYATYAACLVCEDFHYASQGGVGFGDDLGVHLPWPPHLVSTSAPVLSSPQASYFPVYSSTLPSQPEGLLPPTPCWQSLPQPVQPDILDVPPAPPKTSKISMTNPLPRRVVLRKRRVRVGPPSRVKAVDKGDSGVCGGGGVCGSVVRRGPRMSRRGGVRGLWVPKLRCFRRRPSAEANLYEQFQFKTGQGGDGTLAGVEGGGDERTTVMIKNIPNKLSKGQLLSLLDAHCRNENVKVAAFGNAPTQDDRDKAVPSQFDFFYLPVDFGTGSNLGYAFVNFTNIDGANRLHRDLHRRSWRSYGSKKVCEVTYARIQGLAALLKHFNGATFLCDNDELLPVRFDPPRDGECQGLGSSVGKRCPVLRRR